MWSRAVRSLYLCAYSAVRLLPAQHLNPGTSSIGMKFTLALLLPEPFASSRSGPLTAVGQARPPIWILTCGRVAESSDPFVGAGDRSIDCLEVRVRQASRSEPFDQHQRGSAYRQLAHVCTASQDRFHIVGYAPEFQHRSNLH